MYLFSGRALRALLNVNSHPNGAECPSSLTMTTVIGLSEAGSHSVGTAYHVSIVSYRTNLNHHHYGILARYSGQGTRYTITEDGILARYSRQGTQYPIHRTYDRSSPRQGIHHPAILVSYVQVRRVHTQTTSVSIDCTYLRLPPISAITSAKDLFTC